MSTTHWFDVFQNITKIKYVQAPVTLATLTEGPMGYLAEIVGSLPTIIGGLYKDGWEPPKVHAFFECMHAVSRR